MSEPLATKDQDMISRLLQKNELLRETVRILVDRKASPMAVQLAEDVLAGDWPLR